MHCFGRNDLTQLEGNLRNIIIMSCDSATYGNNFLNLYDITKGKLLRYSILFSFAYLLFPPNCISGNTFCQLYNDNVLSTVK